jgi:hypothetical protein
MYKDTGGGLNYTTFMDNTYMADFNLTNPADNPDILRYNQTQTEVPWISNSITIKDLEVPASSSIYLVLKIVITQPGIYVFDLTSPNVLFNILPTHWRVGGAATISVPDEYGTIQAAVTAASPGGTVVVYDGVYDEQVVINKNLTIQGMGSATVIKPSSAAKLNQVFDGLFWYGAPNTKQIAGIIVANVPDGSNVTIKNLKVDESSVITKPTGADYLTGIFYRETGGTIDTVNITGTGAWSGSDRAYGIYLSAATNTASIQITNSTIADYDKNGIEAMGNKLTFSIRNNVLTGRGSVGDEVQNGINAGRGSVGTVNNNTISNLIYPPETWWAAGILFVDSNGSADGNNITDCQIGIIFQDGNGSARGNIVNGTTVGLIGLWAQYTKAGAWTASFVNNTASGVKDSSGYENAAIGAQSWNENASITATISSNRLIGDGSTNADGIFIGDVPAGSPAGNITVTVINNTISGLEYGVRLESSVLVAGSRVGFNNIVGNQLYGIVNNCTGILDARYNWWGNETGPAHPTLNPDGKGDSVSNNVDFKPWLVQPNPPMVPVTELYVDPQLVQCWTGLNKTLQVKVKLDNVKLLYGFEFKLRWNSTLLNLTGASYSSLWTDTYLWQHIWDNSIGEYRLALSARGSVSAFTGNATLATLAFAIIYEPVYPNNVSSNLGLVDTLLSRTQNLTLAEPILHLVYNGTYMCNYTLPKIATGQPIYMIERTPYANGTLKEFDVKVNVTYVVNLTAFKFTFTYDPELLEFVGWSGGTNTSIAYDPERGIVEVQRKGISPPLNGTLTLVTLRLKLLESDRLVWNNAVPSVGCNLTITSTSLNGTGDIPIVHDAINGTYRYKRVPGDLPVPILDGEVDIRDLAFAAKAFGLRSTDPDWNTYQLANVYVDNTINILDIIIIARNFGRTEPE